MPNQDKLNPDLCNGMALGQPTCTAHFSILSKLAQMKTATNNRLTVEMVMDRAIVGRNILPVQHDELIQVRRKRKDRRGEELHLTKSGIARLQLASASWERAQRQFYSALRGELAASMRALREATPTDLGPTALTQVSARA